MGFWRDWNNGFYGGSGATRSVGARYDVALAGRGYMIDETQQGDFAYGFRSIPLLRSGQISQPQNVGELSLNVEDYWRRSAESWHLGAGQLFFDHQNSDDRRFRTSKGVDVWTPGQLSLLNDTALAASSSEAVNLLVVCGDQLYNLVGTTLRRTSAITGTPSWTSITDAGPDDAIEAGTKSMTTDGATVWVADSTRVHYSASSGTTYDKYHTSDHVATLIRSTKGRLLSAKDNVLYTHSGAAGSAVATALFAHPTSAWEWTDIAGGPNAIYFGGYAGDKSAIYATTIEADGTDLEIPHVVATLPDGELAQSLYAYLNVLVIGTSNGIRIAELQGDGSLILGALIELDNAPLCFEGQGRFVWFGWTDYDGDSTGLGRLDLSTFTNDAPAYASDLMAATDGDVLSVVTFGGIRVFSVSEAGIYREDTTSLVAEGTLYSGWANFGLADPKIAVKFLVAQRDGAGTFTVALATDDQPVYEQLGAEATTDVAVTHLFPAGLIRGNEWEWKLTLARSDTATIGPVIRRVTLLANPTADRRTAITLPLLLHREVVLKNRATGRFDPAFERRIVSDLASTGQVILYQESGESYNVTVDNFRWLPSGQPGTSLIYDGTLIVDLKITG